MNYTISIFSDVKARNPNLPSELEDFNARMHKLAGLGLPIRETQKDLDALAKTVTVSFYELNRARIADRKLLIGQMDYLANVLHSRMNGLEQKIDAVKNFILLNQITSALDSTNGTIVQEYSGLLQEIEMLKRLGLSKILVDE